MLKTIQIRVDDTTKNAVDRLFRNLGLDTDTAVQMFFRAAIEKNGLPCTVKCRQLQPEVEQAIENVRNGRNLSAAFITAKDAVASMLED